MEDLFRFLMLRPPEMKLPARDAIPLSPSEPLWQNIVAAMRQRRPAAGVRAVAREHLATSAVGGTSALTNGESAPRGQSSAARPLGVIRWAPIAGPREQGLVILGAF